MKDFTEQFSGPPDTEWGVFTDEGMICGDFYSEQAAWDFARDPANGCTEPDGTVGKDIVVAQVCPEHRTEAKTWCAPCNSDEDEGPPEEEID